MSEGRQIVVDLAKRESGRERLGRRKECNI